MKVLVLSLCLVLASVGCYTAEERKQENRSYAEKIRENMVYFRDTATNLCFAYSNTSAFHPQTSVMANVPCEALRHDQLIDK